MASSDSTAANLGLEGGSAPKQNVRLIFSALALVLLLAALDQTIVATALPTIVAEIGGLEHLSWIVTGYLLASTIVTPLYGKLGDLFGRKTVLQTAIVIFLAGSALCGMAQNLLALILFRFLQGLGGGGLMSPPWPLSAMSSRRPSVAVIRACSAQFSAWPRCSGR